MFVALVAIAAPGVAAACVIGADESSVRLVRAQLRQSGDALATSNVPKAQCGPDDRPETGLQGQVPVSDRLTGRAADGYNCNLRLIGGYGAAPAGDATAQAHGAWLALDTYRHCAYYSNTSYGEQNSFGDALVESDAGGVVVLDVSDPRHPTQTDYLTARAMQQPWESLKVNAKRGLLVADHYTNVFGQRATGNVNHALAVYDISKDCTHPEMLFSGDMPNAGGHEGYFAPDGQTYYMTDGASNQFHAIDLGDPREPKEIGPLVYDGISSPHGGSTSADGTRIYQCELGTGSVAVLDASAVESRQRPEVSLLGRVALPNNQWCQATYPIEYRGAPYVVQFGETTVMRCPDTQDENLANFDVPRIIDIADERDPKLVAELRREVDEPENCDALTGDNTSLRSQNYLPGAGGGPFSLQWFVYDVHLCSPDRLIDPTILACSARGSGLRVFDIRDPQHVNELAYYNLGTRGATDPSLDYAMARPIVRTVLGQIWFTTEWGGFHVAQFEAGVWPFRRQACGKRRDYFWRHYNPDSPCLERK